MIQKYQMKFLTALTWVAIVEGVSIEATHASDLNVEGQVRLEQSGVKIRKVLINGTPPQAFLGGPLIPIIKTKTDDTSSSAGLFTQLELGFKFFIPTDYTKPTQTIRIATSYDDDIFSINVSDAPPLTYHGHDFRQMALWPLSVERKPIPIGQTTSVEMDMDAYGRIRKTVDTATQVMIPTTVFVEKYIREREDGRLTLESAMWLGDGRVDIYTPCIKSSSSIMAAREGVYFHIKPRSNTINLFQKIHFVGMPYEYEIDSVTDIDNRFLVEGKKVIKPVLIEGEASADQVDMTFCGVGNASNNAIYIDFYPDLLGDAQTIQDLYQEGLNYRDGKLGYSIDLDRAKVLFESVVVASTANHAKALHNLAYILHKQGEWIQAELYYQKASQLGLEASTRNLQRIRSNILI